MVVGAIVIVALVAVGGIWYMGRKSNPEAVPMALPTTPAATGAAMTVSPTVAGQTVELTVEGSNFQFAPATLKVKKGQKIGLTFKNTGGTHDLVIDELNVHTDIIGSGQQQRVEFVADKVGTFAYYCSVSNHRAMGMQGTLTGE